MSQCLMPDYLVCIERIDRDFTTKHEAAARLLTAHQITYTHKPTVHNSSRFSMFNTYVSTSLIMFVSVCLSAYLHTVDCRWCKCCIYNIFVNNFLGNISLSVGRLSAIAEVVFRVSVNECFSEFVGWNDLNYIGHNLLKLDQNDMIW